MAEPVMAEPVMAEPVMAEPVMDEPVMDETVMDEGAWKTHLTPDSRHRIVNKIVDKLKRHLPVSGQEGLRELREIAERFEEKIYSAATSQSDYLRKISLKILTLETKSFDAATNSLPSNSAGDSKKSSNGKKSPASKKSHKSSFVFPRSKKALYGPKHQRHGCTAFVLIRKARVSLQLSSHPRRSQSQRPAQGEPVMDRGGISPDPRHRMVDKIMDTLRRHVPVSGPVELHELRKVAERFEENIFSATTGESDYIRKISLKMLELEKKSLNAPTNALPSNSAAHSNESNISRL